MNIWVLGLNLLIGVVDGGSACPIVDLHRLTSPPIHSNHPALRGLYDTYQDLPPTVVTALASRLKYIAGYETELTPVTIDSLVSETVEMAARQRIRAAKLFLQDIYRNRRPTIYNQFPELRWVMESSPHFVREIVDTPASHAIDFDLVLAMDWVVSKNLTRNDYSIEILESDAGSIGGIIRTSAIYEGIIEAWGMQPGITDMFLPTSSMADQAEFHRQVAARYGDGTVAFYTEMDSPTLFAPQDSPHPFRALLKDLKIPIISSHNNKPPHLEYDERRGLYTFHREPIHGFWTRYYPQSMDPEAPHYSRVSPNFKTEFEISHALPGFWRRYFFEEGYKRWYMWNPLGVEIFIDKAVMMYLPKMIQFYLGEKPIIYKETYQLLADGSGNAHSVLIDQIEKNPSDWVLKSRRDAGQGAGVYVGAHLKDGRKHSKTNLGFSDVLRLVRENPQEWVAQIFLPETYLELPNGRTRHFEVRNISYTVGGGSAQTVGVPYIRSSAPGVGRNLSGSAQIESSQRPSIIPVLVPRTSPVWEE